jgi:hypothetical protein
VKLFRLVQDRNKWRAVVNKGTSYRVPQNAVNLLTTVIPRLTSDPAKEIFRLTKIFFAVFRTRLTNMDSANECFSVCSR